ncbi:MAG: hypothetical protein ACRDSP_22415 [Pseudonocardiaceae bacterium]
MSHRPTDAAAEREVLPLRRQGPNAVERAARVTQIVARPSRRTDQILVPCAAYTSQHRPPATPLEHHPARS